MTGLLKHRQGPQGQKKAADGDQLLFD